MTQIYMINADNNKYSEILERVFNLCVLVETDPSIEIIFNHNNLRHLRSIFCRQAVI